MHRSAIKMARGERKGESCVYLDGLWYGEEELIGADCYYYLAVVVQSADESSSSVALASRREGMYDPVREALK